MNGRWPFVLLVGSQGLMAAEPGRIEIFTSARSPVATTAGRAVQIYTLDAHSGIETGLSAILPADRAAAEALARHRIPSTWRPPAEALTEAYQGLFKARQYGLDKLPAIVFDGKAVVYGVRDLEQALGEYQRWRDSKR